MTFTQNIVLDISRESGAVICAKQGDRDSRFLRCTVFANGVQTAVSGGTTVCINAKREADGASSSCIGTVNADGTVTVPVTPFMTDYAGEVSCSVSLTEANAVIGTMAFRVIVYPQENAAHRITVYYVNASLTAGTYYLQIGGTAYSFTTSATVYAGGVIKFNAALTTAYAYATETSATPSQTMVITPSASGTQLVVTGEASIINTLINALAGKQDVIDTDHKLTADLTCDGVQNKCFTAAEKTKLSGIEAEAQKNTVLSVNSRTGDVTSLAEADGSYEDMTVGHAEQMVSTTAIEDKVPYLFRASCGGADIGDREEDTLVGGTVAWNQLVQNGNFADASGWRAFTPASATLSVSDNKATITSNYSGVGGDCIAVFHTMPYSVIGHKYIVLVDYELITGNALLPVAECGVSYVVLDNVFGKKYGKIITADRAYNGLLLKVSGTKAVGDSWTFSNCMIIDLTEMFGAAVANTMTVAQFKSLFPKPYYAYHEGQLLSVNASSHDTVGFNQWDEQWEVGSYDTSTGAKVATQNVRSKGFIKVLPNVPYYVKIPVGNVYALEYDDNKSYLGSYKWAQNSSVTFSGRTRYITFYTVSYGSAYRDDICINLSHTGYRNGEYEPYRKNTYALDGTLTLRGIPKADGDGKMYYDGDTYEADGTVTRRYGVVDLGSLMWQLKSSSTHTFYTWNLQNIGAGKSANLTANIICDRYVAETANNCYINMTVDKSVCFSDSGYVGVNDSSYTDAAAFKTAMSGVYLVYELATPTEESAAPFQTPQKVDDFGTEAYTVTEQSGVAVPVGHDTLYRHNLRDKLQRLPDMPAATGTYLVRYNASTGKCAFVSFPTAGTGTFVLKSVGGTLTWTEEEQE